MQAVGLLLVSSPMIIPAPTAMRLANSFRQILLFAGLNAFYLDTAPGGTIVLTALLLFAAASLVEARVQREA